MFFFHIFREKIGPKINYKGIDLTTNLTKEHGNSFIYVGEAYRIENFRSAFMSTQRDFDVLQELLGKFQSTISIYPKRKDTLHKLRITFPLFQVL